MSPLLVSLFTFLWAAVGADITVVQHPAPKQIAVANGHSVTAPGWMLCYSADRIELHVTPGLTFEGWLHELAHAYDCADDGKMNGSPGHPRPETFREAKSIAGKAGMNSLDAWACWSGHAPINAVVVEAVAGAVPAKSAPASAVEVDERRGRSEWYACLTANTGRVR